jgi:MoxR-like ATPase
MDQKACRKCGVLFDLTPDNFFRSSASPDGFATKCKTCYRSADGSARSPRPAQQRSVVRTDTGFIASRELLAVWDAVSTARDAGGHAMNLFFVGPSGSGKTRAASHLATIAGLSFTKVDAPAMTDPESWFGTREVVAKDGVPVTVYRPSTFVTAVQQPGVLLLDEMNRIRDEHRQILLALLDGTHQVTNPLNGEVVVKHPDCIIVMSGNVGLQFTGTYAVDPALMTRALTVRFGYLAAEDEIAVAIAESAPVEADRCDEATARLFVRFATETRTRAMTDPDMLPISTREVISACRLVARGLSADLAAMTAMIDGASDEGGTGGVRDRLVNIWTGIRPGAKTQA